VILDRVIRASVIDLYLHTIFHWYQKNFSPRTIGRDPRSSRSRDTN